MKKAFTFVLLLAATSMLVSSCGLISTTSINKSHNSGSFYVEPGDAQKSAPMNEEMNTYQMKGETFVQTDIEELRVTETDNMIESDNIIQIPSQQSLFTSSLPIERSNQNIASINEYSPEITGVNENSIGEFSKFNNINNTANNSAGPSSRGVPFIIVFLFAFFIPPVGVALMFGITDKFWICLVLTLLFWLPGMIYAMIQIF